MGFGVNRCDLNRLGPGFFLLGEPKKTHRERRERKSHRERMRRKRAIECLNGMGGRSILWLDIEEYGRRATEGGR